MFGAVIVNFRPEPEEQPVENLEIRRLHDTALAVTSWVGKAKSYEEMDRLERKDFNKITAKASKSKYIYESVKPTKLSSL